MLMRLVFSLCILILVASISDAKRWNKKPKQAKSSWPELVGEEVDRAVEIVLTDRPDAEIVIIRSGLDGMISITDDYMANRVRLFVDLNDLVFRVPHIG